MKTLYTLTIRASVELPVGGLQIDVGGERTFIFGSVEERQKVVDWARENGFDNSTSIDHVMTAREVKTEIMNSIDRTCDYFHCSIPIRLKDTAV
jgi:hypothetical protein